MGAVAVAFGIYFGWCGNNTVVMIRCWYVESCGIRLGDIVLPTWIPLPLRAFVCKSKRKMKHLMANLQRIWVINRFLFKVVNSSTAGSEWVARGKDIGWWEDSGVEFLLPQMVYTMRKRSVKFRDLVEWEVNYVIFSRWGWEIEKCCYY